MVGHVRQQGATAIGLDVFVPAGMKNLPEINTLGGVGDGWKMGQAVLRAGNVVLPQRLAEDGWLRPLPQWRLKERVRPEAMDRGFADLSEDGDQLIRRQTLLSVDGGRLLPHFALALLCRGAGRRSPGTRSGGVAGRRRAHSP